MEFITDAVATELGLTEAQINGIKPLYDNHVATIRQESDTTANTNAENIIAGAISSTQKKFNIDLPRNQSEKNADYLVRLNEKVVETQKSNIDALELEYKQKIKDFDGGSATKSELEKAKADLDAAQLKLADFDALKEKADKYEPLESEYNSLKEQVFFQNEKPNFPDTVNPYEAKAKWDDFVKDVKDKYTISIVDGVSVATSKENVHIKKNLSDLVKADANITALLQGRKQSGSGAQHQNNVSIEGIPFDIPVDATSSDISKAINGYLEKQGLSKTDKEWSKKFQEFHSKIKDSRK